MCLLISGTNAVEMYRIIQAWSQVPFMNSLLFQSCIKYQFIVKTYFCIFSLFANLLAIILCLGLIIDYLFFAQKIMSSYLNLVYYIFGPCLLFSSILGIANWNETTYLCYRNNPKLKYFSISYGSSIVCCLVISLTITLLVEVYDSIALYTKTITRQPDGNRILYSLFWFITFKLRNSTSTIRSSTNENRENNHNNATNNLITNSTRISENNINSSNDSLTLPIQNQLNANNNIIFVREDENKIDEQNVYSHQNTTKSTEKPFYINQTNSNNELDLNSRV